MRRLVILAVLLATLGVTGCGDDKPADPPTEPPTETPEEPAVPAGPNQVGSGGGFGG